MLNRVYPTVYNKSPKKEMLWKIRGFALFARLKNHMIVFTKARKAKMDMQNNVKYVGWLKIGNITKIILKFVLQNIKDGLSEIQKTFSKTKEHITNVIKSVFWKKCENQEKEMNISIQKPIAKEIEKKLNVTILSDWLSNSDKLRSSISVKDAKTIVRHKLIIMIIPNLWTLFGYVVNVMGKSTEHLYQRERLNLWTPKGDVIVQTTEETCRGEFEAVPPPRNRSVSLAGLKVIEWLRHTAGCSFYQGQCITNDLWIQNLRSTGI